MSRFAVVLAPQAEDDIAGAIGWYREKSTAAAKAFRNEVFAAVDELARTASAWRLDEDGSRRRVLKRFPYSLVFDVAGDTATVLALAHHRREPGYWKA